MARNARQPLPIPSSASCRCRPSTRRSCSRCCRRSGRPRRSRRSGCAAGSRACSTGRRCAVIARATTRRAGKGTSITCCRRRASCSRCGTIRRCRSSGAARSWPRCAAATASPRGLLEVLALTCVRTSELTGATWGEVDLRAKVWTVPAERMKKRREHRVPLSDRVVEILRALPAAPPPIRSLPT